MKSTVTHKGNWAFEGELDGHTIMIDAGESMGGEDRGPRPKGLMLTSLAGCTGFDVIMILRKMRAEPEEFRVEAETELSDTQPSVFTGITLTYYFKGGNVTREKAEKAVSLSEEKYCGVSAMLTKAVPIETKIVIE